MGQLRRVLSLLTLLPTLVAAPVHATSPVEVSAAATLDEPIQTELEVSLTNPADGVTLRGTLTLPAGSGPFPGVVMVHGSGPQSRDESSAGSLLFYHSEAPVPFFDVVAEHLARGGVASLRYDKRTCIVSNSEGACPTTELGWDPETATLDLFASDARVAVRWLRGRPEIMSEGLVILGHSQGATLAPAIAAEEPGVVGIVLIGSPASENPVEDHNAQQARILRFLLVHQEQDHERVAELGSTIQEESAAVAAIVAGTRTEPFRGSSVVFWCSWFENKRATRERLETLEVPVLAITGGLDQNLPVHPHLNTVRRWRGDRTGDLMLEVPRTSHALVGLDPDRFRPAVHAGFLELLPAWVLSTTQGSEISDEVGKRITQAGTLGGWGDPITPLRDAVLCQAAERDCDLDGIGAHMSAGMLDALPPAELTRTVADRLGSALTTTETMQVNIYGTADDTTWCQDDLLTSEEGALRLMRTCWRQGPELVGLFFK